MKKIWIGIVLAFLMGTLPGCVKDTKQYDKNTIIVKRNGSVEEVAVEDYTDSSVKAEDLNAYIDEQITAYNTDQDKKAVKNKSLDTEDMSKVKLVLSYKSIEDFNGFNSLECSLKDADECKESDLIGSFKSAEDEKSVKKDDILETKKAKVFTISEKTDVVVKGDILYYNDQVTVKDNIATVVGDEEAIIVFK